MKVSKKRPKTTKQICWHLLKRIKEWPFHYQCIKCGRKMATQSGVIVEETPKE